MVDVTVPGTPVVGDLDHITDHEAINTALSVLETAVTDNEVGKSDNGHTHSYAADVHTHQSTDIADSTAEGRSVLTAASYASIRSLIGAGTSSFDGAYSSLTGKPTLGTASALDVPAAGDAAPGEVVKGTDTRLSDARTPTTHGHTNVASGDISDATAVGEALMTAVDAAAARSAIGAGVADFSGSYNDLTDKPTLGTAAPKNVAAAGDAASDEVVVGGDSRMTNARTPTAHSFHTTADISDVTATGQAVAQAASASAARTAIGAGTSSFSGDYADLTSKPNLDLKANLDSPALTGNPTAPTQAADDNTTKVATTAYVQGELGDRAPLASPALTGSPTAPTQTSTDDSTKIATTAFVQTAVASGDLVWNPGTSQWYRDGAVIASGTRPTDIPTRPNGPGAALYTDMDATFTEPPHRQTGAKEMPMAAGDRWFHAGGITLTNLDADV